MSRSISAIVLMLVAAQAGAQITLTSGTNFTIDVAPTGRLAMDLVGSIWIVPPQGGRATALTGGTLPARRPRWAPDASALVYQVRDKGQERLYLYCLDQHAAEVVSDGQYYDQHPDWHPDGTRLVYSSDRRDSGFDLWELDLATRLTWRISHLPGDETEPAWSADGVDLAYVHYRDGRWSLMLRRRGQPDRVLESSTTRLSAPSWRPDGSLLTFLRHGANGLTIDMAILSDPVLVRPLVTGEDFFVGPVAWRDRQNLLYTANGLIRTREFNSWTSRTLSFRATVRPPAAAKRPPPPGRELPPVEEPDGTLVIRAARLFDGVSSGYRYDLDVVIEGGRIAATEARRNRDGAIVVDLGDLTILPGFVDSDAALGADAPETLGPALLAFGITTVVADDDDVGELDRRWAGKTMPGPRVLPAGWQPDLDSLSALVPGTDAFPVSPAGIRYENVQLTAADSSAMHVSGLADVRTEGLRDLQRSRQAALFAGFPTAIRRYVEAPALGNHSPPIVLASDPNGLPPGIGLHAEFLALAEAGLVGADVLRSAGINAAAALGLGHRVGRVAPGAAADLVIVDGDPIGSISAARKVVGVVRNGRFYSTVGLIERIGTAESVE